MNRQGLPLYGSVQVVAPSGVRTTLFHGDIIGRLWTAALVLSDPRISEFHAMVSSRGGQMWMLPLRGGLQVDGSEVTRHLLEIGDRITLADGVSVDIVHVQPASSALRVSAEGIDSTLETGVVSLFGGSAPRVQPGWDERAMSRMWPDGQSWFRSSPQGPVRMDDVCEWTVDGCQFRAVIVESGGVCFTDESDYQTRFLRIVARFDSVHIHRSEGEVPCVLTGRSARLLSELVSAQGPVHWREVAQLLWPAVLDTDLRRRWDVELARLRRTLRDAGIRSDLCRADGSGNVGLVLGPIDVVVDET